VNTIQEAIANLIGLDDVIEEFQTERMELADTMEHLVSDNALLQRQIEDLDYLNLFDINQIAEVLPIGDRKKVLARLRRLRHDNPLAKQAVKLVVRFTLGKGVQWVLASPESESPEMDETVPVGNNLEPARGTALPPPPTKLVQLPRAARSRQEQIVGATDQGREILEAFWEDQDNKLAFTTHHTMQTMLDEMVTDGEKFYACFEGEAEPYVKVSEIPLEEIVQVIYDPNNKLRPVYYKRQYQEMEYDGQADQYRPKGQPKSKYYLDYRITDEMLADIKKNIKIPAAKIDKTARIRHVMINELWTKSGKRGLSELYASREWFRVFREFMEGRASINSAAQAISYVRKIKGGPTSVAQFGGKFGGLTVGGDTGSDSGTEIRKLTRPIPGAIYDSNQAVDLEWMKTDTGAANAKEDARMILMSAGAGVGTMVHYFGEGGDANLATAQSMELPMVKSYEDWQQFIEDFYKDWFEYVLMVALKDEEATHEVLERIGFSFPPIISQDIVKYTTSWAQIVRDIAPNNMTVREQAIRAVLTIMGVPNIDGLMPQVEAEAAAAEVLRQQQQQALLNGLNNSDDANGNGNKPPVAGKTPNAAMGPNMKKLVAGRGEKVSNGPKPT